MARPGRANPYSSAALQNSQPTNTAPDLSILSAQPSLYSSSTPSVPSVDDIARSLVARLSNGQNFTNVGRRCLVALGGNAGGEERSKDYAKVFKDRSDVHNGSSNATTDSDATGAKLPPSVFETAESAYYHMLRMGEDQCIVLTGETASGKSESFRNITRHLCDLSKTSSKKTKVHSAVLKAEVVLAAFSRAQTPSNRDASCCTLYAEYQFDAKGKMVGLKLIDYLLDKSRVTGPVDGGRNFHIFYHLLAGATQDEKLQLHLSDPAHFHYLSQSSIRGADNAYSTTSFDVIRDNLKTLGIGRRQQAQFWQLLAAILHLGNVTFHDDPKNNDESCSVRNYAQLELVASLLGLHPASMEACLTYRTKLIGRDLTSVFLDSTGAEQQRDALARALYAVATSWIVEQINDKLCQDESAWSSFVAVLDTPGFAGRDTRVPNGFQRLLVNFANEKLRTFVDQQLFDVPREVFLAEQLKQLPVNTYKSNREILALLTSPKSGVLSNIDMESARGTKDSKITEKLYSLHGQPSATDAHFVPARKQKHAFGIRHYAGEVEYDTRGFQEANTDTLQPDFVTLVRGSPEQPGTANLFLRSMFSDRLVATQTSKRDGKTVVAAQSRILRNPSMKRRKSKKEDDEDNADPSETVGHQFRTAVGELMGILSDTQTWFVFHVRTTEEGSGASSARNADLGVVTRQVEYLDLVSLVSNPATVYTAAFPHAEFIQRYKAVVGGGVGDPHRACSAILEAKSWKNGDAALGKSRIFLAEKVWRALEVELQKLEEAKDKEAAMSAYAPSEGDYDDNGSMFDDGVSHYESEFEYDRSDRALPNAAEDGNVSIAMKSLSKSDIEMANNTSTTALVSPEKQSKPKKKLSGTRKRWLCCTWFSTWWVFPCCLSICGRMKPADRQMAWREKVTLCLIIVLMNAAILFFIVGLGFVLCPRKNELSPGEITSRFELNDKATVHMYGHYYEVPNIWKVHGDRGWQGTSGSDGFWRTRVLGKDVSQMFPKVSVGDNHFGELCPGLTQPPTFAQFPADITNGDFNLGAWYPHAYNDFLKLQGTRKGTVVWAKQSLQEGVDDGHRFIVAYDKIFDVTAFYAGTYKDTIKITGSNFFGQRMTSIMDKFADINNIGLDATGELNAFRGANPEEWRTVMNCMLELFYVGQVDHRNDLQCQVPNYILLVASAVVVSVIGFKFLAALQFGGKKSPEECDKFVICQVPCYTEGEASLLRTMESLATLDYDDKHKLLFVICDGMIIGSGNDRPTPRIVLDILGVDPSIDPEPLMFQSLGEGMKQLNMAKVWSGLYEIQGHVVPFVVVAKVGKVSERQRPGNRGKRDSQLILMKFLSHVHFNQPMCPLELELYHQMKNVIGVDPSFYEYIFMVDADTEVMPDSLNRLVSSMARDSKIAGICGETQISNERDTWVSMIQVYEYFISHNMAKAFESLFGSVTCLPGCFSMYRIRTPVKNVPLLISPQLVNDYSENVVDTLHLKNLLHLGEDRYLTTLILKHFPNMKTTFTSSAKCKTNAPDKWSVLLSQRRRWINSTVHNLLELLWLPEMCGFCCFSMRFVVFLDLFATFVQPAALGYIIYLVYATVSDTETQFPLISIIMIAAIYGFQMIIFLLKREWQHIGWMIIYMLAMPIFGAYIPLYSFWHFDDFSWGNTRRVIEEHDGKKVEKIVEVKEEEFDEALIPLRKWSDFESERVERDERMTESSWVSRESGMTRQNVAASGYAGSAYGGASVYNGGASVYGGSVYPASIAPPQPPAYDHRISFSPMDYQRTHTAPQSSSLQRQNSLNSSYSNPRALPTDDEILSSVRQILATADLMSVTKKSVREELGRIYGVDLAAKKEWIHLCIDGVLRGEL
ncbi:hypothetical protein HDU85_003891 [Gaertneriomyces sp. JEL0708]|nr:hypothetical protein HDU85_003891 [Gaertneriomyces sp. JEL0708]